MDQPCSYEVLRDCLESIAQVNRLTHAYRPTLHWLNRMYSGLQRQEKPLHIVDIGCGYGDFLRRIHSWAQDMNLPVILTGIDVNPDAIRAARAATRPGTATFITCDALDFKPPVAIDLIVSSLLMHHLEATVIVALLDWMETRARLGWFINDLHRTTTPVLLTRLFARFLPIHPFVKHDAPVSILRSFRREDWQIMLKAAAIPEGEYLIREYRPARLCVARLH